MKTAWSLFSMRFREMLQYRAPNHIFKIRRQKIRPGRIDVSHPNHFVSRIDGEGQNGAKGDAGAEAPGELLRFLPDSKPA